MERTIAGLKSNTCMGSWNSVIQIKTVLWIRIRMDPHQSDKLDPNPNPDQHQSDKLVTDPHQYRDDKPNCMEYVPISAIFQGFEPLFGS